jgi:hypothetical protein
MAEKLSWEEIKIRYHQQWVELVDYDWPDSESDPHSGVVRVHARSRKEFDKLAAKEAPSDSAYVFVGRQSLPKDTLLSTFRVIEVE